MIGLSHQKYEIRNKEMYFHILIHGKKAKYNIGCMLNIFYVLYNLFDFLYKIFVQKLLLKSTHFNFPGFLLFNFLCPHSNLSLKLIIYNK